ncbi:MAG: hypothetical protein C4346_09995 [Chloroflexota bacterium]
MTLETVPLEEARALALAAQGLASNFSGAAPTKECVLEVIDALGCIQLDSINVVARSHETVLWSRLGSYEPALIEELYQPDRAVAEYWAHAAALVPTAMLPLFVRRMRSYRDPSSPHYAAWQPQPEVNAAVLRAIREQGPLSSRAFARPPGPRPEAWSWWGGKPESKALDYLWTCGELAIQRRVGFERVYDLMERHHPHLVAIEPPPEEEERRTFVRRALAALGVATPRWIADYFRTGSKPYVPPRLAEQILQSLELEGKALRVRVNGITEPAWLSASAMLQLHRLRSGRWAPERTTLLSPFDNLIWHRQRTAALFGFEYRLESYTPAARRRYGYYTLPILHRGALVGRLDPHFDRRRGVLTIKSLHLEPDTPPSQELAQAMREAITAYCQFLGARDWQVLATDPPALESRMPAMHRRLVSLRTPGVQGVQTARGHPATEQQGQAAGQLRGSSRHGNFRDTSAAG